MGLVEQTPLVAVELPILTDRWQSRPQGLLPLLSAPIGAAGASQAKHPQPKPQHL